MSSGFSLLAGTTLGLVGRRRLYRHRVLASATDQLRLALMIAPFGASCVLLFALPSSPPALWPAPATSSETIFCRL